MLEYIKSTVQRFLLGKGSRPTGLPQWRISSWSFIGAFISITVLELLFSLTNAFEMDHVPMIIASFGASAVLLYGSIESPLSQPRNCFFGHVLSAVIGVCITRLFQLSPQFDNLRWLAGSLSMAVALVVMQFTGNVHPPGGATALIAAVQNEAGWLYIGIVALSAIIMIAIALLVNNVERRWPVFWWAPKKIIVINRDESDGQDIPTSVASHESSSTTHHAASSVTAPGDDDEGAHHHIVVSPTEIILPAHFTEDDRAFLKSLQVRLSEKA